MTNLRSGGSACRLAARTRMICHELVAMPIPGTVPCHIAEGALVDGPTFVSEHYVALVYQGRTYKCHVDEFVEAVASGACASACATTSA
jgi:hypothetical protein